MNWNRLFFSMNGRIGRRDFWIAQLVFLAVQVVVWLAFWFAVGSFEGSYDVAAQAASPVTVLLLLYPAICVTVKRLHDLNRSGWWMLAAGILSFTLAASSRLTSDVQSSTWLVASALFVWPLGFFVWTGFFSGSGGANAFGEPDSGARRAMAAAEAAG